MAQTYNYGHFVGKDFVNSAEDYKQAAAQGFSRAEKRIKTLTTTALSKNHPPQRNNIKTGTKPPLLFDRKALSGAPPTNYNKRKLAEVKAITSRDLQDSPPKGKYAS